MPTAKQEHDWGLTIAGRVGWYAGIFGEQTKDDCPYEESTIRDAWLRGFKRGDEAKERMKTRRVKAATYEPVAEPDEFIP